MNCGQVEEILIEDVSSAERAEVYEHLETCASCGRFYQQLKTLEELNRSLSRIYEAPEDFEGRIATSVQAQRRTTWATISAFLSLVVILGGGFIAYQELGEDYQLGTPKEMLSNGYTSGASPVLLSPERPGLRHSDQQFYFPSVEVVVANPDSGELDLEIPSPIQVRDQDLRQDSYLTQVSH